MCRARCRGCRGWSAARGGNIVEVHHQRLFQDSSVKRAELDVVVETQNRRHVDADRRRADRRRLSDPVALGERRGDVIAPAYDSVCVSTGTTSTRSTRRPSISTTSKR